MSNTHGSVELRFNPDDVVKVAQAVVSMEPYLVECRSDYLACPFCGATQRVYYENGDRKTSGKFPHEAECAVLVAIDLLTGATHEQHWKPQSVEFKQRTRSAT